MNRLLLLRLAEALDPKAFESGSPHEVRRAIAKRNVIDLLNQFESMGLAIVPAKPKPTFWHRMGFRDGKRPYHPKAFYENIYNAVIRDALTANPTEKELG